MADDNKEMVLVQSKVRDVIREKDLRTSDEFITALNAHVHHLLHQAMHRCKENGRQTLRPQDV
jgi:histone H3/H4